MNIEFISFQVARFPEDQYLRYFIGRLQPKIRLHACTFNPVNRIQVIHVARNVEMEKRDLMVPRGSGTSGTKTWIGNKE